MNAEAHPQMPRLPGYNTGAHIHFLNSELFFSEHKSPDVGGQNMFYLVPVFISYINNCMFPFSRLLCITYYGYIQSLPKLAQRVPNKAHGTPSTHRFHRLRKGVTEFTFPLILT